MSRPYGYDEGYQDGYEAAELKLQARVDELEEGAMKVLNREERIDSLSALLKGGE